MHRIVQNQHLHIKIVKYANLQNYSKAIRSLAYSPFSSFFGMNA